MTVGAVMPTYNQAAYLPKAIESVIGQVDQLVIVDDGSTDGTPEILAGRDDVVTLLTNCGAANAINVGIQYLRSLNASFDWLTWVSSDNIQYPFWIERLMQHVTPQVGAVYGGFDAIPGPGAKQRRHYCFSPYDSHRLGKHHACYMGPAFIIREDVWHNHRGKHGHDYDNWCRVEESCWVKELEIIGVNEALSAYLMHRDQATCHHGEGDADAPKWLKVTKKRRYLNIKPPPRKRSVVAPPPPKPTVHTPPDRPLGDLRPNRRMKGRR